MAPLLHSTLHAAKIAGLAILSGLGYLLVIVFAVAIVAAVQRGLLPNRLGPPRRPRRPPSSVLSDTEVSADARRIWRKMQLGQTSTLLLAPTSDKAFSKLGGFPELPAGTRWPVAFDHPMGFAAQLDLAEVRAARGPDWLPSTGALFFFYEDPSDAGDQVRLLYAEKGGAEPASPPEGLAMSRRHPERRIKFLPFQSLPTLDWLEEDVRDIDATGEELDALADAPDEPFGDELQHRIAGYPSEIQEEQMAIACEYIARGRQRDWSQPIPMDVAEAAKDWRLLLQIDSDPALKMSWGDAGRLYVFIREGDARVADFSKTVTIWQTH